MAASGQPMSIIIVGVGSADFSGKLRYSIFSFRSLFSSSTVLCKQCHRNEGAG